MLKLNIAKFFNWLKIEFVSYMAPNLQISNDLYPKKIYSKKIHHLYEATPQLLLAPWANTRIGKILLTFFPDFLTTFEFYNSFCCSWVPKFSRSHGQKISRKIARPQKILTWRRNKTKKRQKMSWTIFDSQTKLAQIWIESAFLAKGTFTHSIENAAIELLSFIDFFSSSCTNFSMKRRRSFDDSRFKWIFIFFNCERKISTKN